MAVNIRNDYQMLLQSRFDKPHAGRLLVISTTSSLGALVRPPCSATVLTLMLY